MGHVISSITSEEHIGKPVVLERKIRSSGRNPTKKGRNKAKERTKSLLQSVFHLDIFGLMWITFSVMSLCELFQTRVLVRGLKPIKISAYTMFLLLCTDFYYFFSRHSERIHVSCGGFSQIWRKLLDHLVTFSSVPHSHIIVVFPSGRQLLEEPLP